jgi:hypothetical protein
MIASPEEYTFAVDALKILTDKLANMRKHFDREGHTPEEIKRLTDPIICMLNGRQEEIDEWEKAHPQDLLLISEARWVVTEADYVEVLSKFREVAKGVDAAWKKLWAEGHSEAVCKDRLKPSFDFLAMALGELNDYERATSRPLSKLQ